MMTIVQIRDVMAICSCFSVIKTTKRDRAMMSTELDDSTGRHCVLVCVDSYVLTIFILIP